MEHLMLQKPVCVSSSAKGAFQLLLVSIPPSNDCFYFGFSIMQIRELLIITCIPYLGKVDESMNRMAGVTIEVKTSGTCVTNLNLMCYIPKYSQFNLENKLTDVMFPQDWRVAMLLDTPSLHAISLYANPAFFPHHPTPVMAAVTPVKTINNPYPLPQAYS